MTQKAFVTGSTGLLGNNLVRMLVENGYAVKALTRSREKAERLFEDVEVEIVVGDMEDIDGFVAELDDCDVLCHTAAFFRQYYQPGDHWDILERINVKGTVRLLEESEKRGVSKVVYTSTGGVLARSPDGSPIDETAPPNPLTKTNLYFRSKLEAERAIFKWLETNTLPVVLILPGWMFGPGDAGPTGAGRFVLDYMNQKLPATVNGGTAVVDARDVAQAMVNAIEQGQSGERYIVGGPYVTLDEIVTTLEGLTGVPRPRLRIPYTVAIAYGWILGNLARLTGANPLITVEGVRAVSNRTAVSSEKAKRELGVSFRPLDQTLSDTISWYRTHGYVTAGSL